MFNLPKISRLSSLVALSFGLGCSPSTTTPMGSTVDAVAPVRVATASPAAETAPPRVKKVKITVLSTMLADDGIGEWGFAALVEADGWRILFDTGFRRNTVLKNAEELGIDLRTVTDVVLSHHHDDHVGGLMTLREAVLERTPKAFATAHVGRGIFDQRRKGERDVNPMIPIRTAYEATGGVFVVHDRPAELAPGVWITGPVPRVHPERNWSGTQKVERDGAWVEDTLAEDQSLVVDTERGLVVLSGCGHAGIVNTIEHARTSIRPAPIHAAIGGFHLFNATDEQLAWTATKLSAAGLQQFFGGHCTGLEAVYRFRSLVGLERSASVVAAVGGTFELGKGIAPGALAH
jgi:7,8-dihydropterin-6-yl-methyl-4-(beta-D-ribofuranosyl)aminobenzene 5'-phosphate synthase